MFEEVKKAMAKAIEIAGIVREIDKDVVFMSVMATVFDQWAADHDVEPDEERRMVKKMLKMMEKMHAENGGLQKSV